EADFQCLRLDDHARWKASYTNLFGMVNGFAGFTGFLLSPVEPVTRLLDPLRTRRRLWSSHARTSSPSTKRGARGTCEIVTALLVLPVVRGDVQQRRLVVVL